VGIGVNRIGIGMRLRSLPRQVFVERFVETGDAVESARDAGYFHGSERKLRRIATKLKYELKDSVSDMMRDRIRSVGPSAVATLERLMVHSESETVKLNAAKELLDRSRILEGDQSMVKSVEQLEAELIGLVGADGAKLMMASVRIRRVGSSPQLTPLLN
jgi:hypothetical protein